VPSLAVLLVDPDADTVLSLCDATKKHIQHLHKNRYELETFGLGEQFEEWVVYIHDVKVPSYFRILALLIFIRHTQVLYERLSRPDQDFLGYMFQASEPWCCGRDSQNRLFHSSRPERLEDEHTNMFVWRMCQMYRWMYHVPQASVPRWPG
jgi:hypothetical protein